jgi:D-alanine-D-alanine ligase
MKKILIIYGGNSLEHDISIKSYNTVINSIDDTKYIIDSIYISKDNIWYHNDKEIINIIEFIKLYDLVFPLMHGKYGEDGSIQGMLDMFNIKYIGNSLGTSYLCMNKLRTKEILTGYNIPVLDSNYTMYPLIIKPTNGGSSIGINIVHNDIELDNSIKEVLKYDNSYIKEKYLENPKEYECNCLIKNNEPIIMIGEIIHNNTFYDYKTKYENDYICTNLNPIIDDNIKNKLIYYTKKIINIFNIKDLARVDFLCKEGNIYLNEINTMPGFTDISMFPSIYTNINLTIKDILNILITNNI